MEQTKTSTKKKQKSVKEQSKDIKVFSIRLNMKIYSSIEKIAEKDHRSINGEIEYILDKYLIDSGLKQ